MIGVCCDGRVGRCRVSAQVVRVLCPQHVNVLAVLSLGPHECAGSQAALMVGMTPLVGSSHAPGGLCVLCDGECCVDWGGRPAASAKCGPTGSTGTSDEASFVARLAADDQLTCACSRATLQRCAKGVHVCMALCPAAVCGLGVMCSSVPFIATVLCVHKNAWLLLTSLTRCIVLSAAGCCGENEPNLVMMAQSSCAQQEPARSGA